MSRTLAVLAVALFALLTAPATPTAALQDLSPKTALDLPAMALVPTDLEAEGLDGYAIGIGNLTPWQIEAAFVAQALRLNSAIVADAFDDAGTDRVFKQFLDRYADPEDSEGELLASVVSYAYVGADAADAGALFALVAAGAEATAERTVAAPAVGDDASLTLHNGIEPYLGREATWLALHVHAGEDVVGVVLIDYSGERPDEAAAAALVGRLVERVAAVREGRAPGLAPLALELQWDDEIAFPNAYYLQIDGAAFPVAAFDSAIGRHPETIADNRRRAAYLDAIGAVDVYFLSQPLRGGRAGSAQDYYYEVVLLRFGDEAAAKDYVAGLPDRYAGDRNIVGLTQLDGLPDDGDEAVGFAYRVDHGESTGTWHHAATYVRVGELVARVDAFGVTALQDGAARLAEAQARCLVDGGCPNPLAAPAELRSEGA